MLLVDPPMDLSALVKYLVIVGVEVIVLLLFDVDVTLLTVGFKLNND